MEKLVCFYFLQYAENVITWKLARNFTIMGSPSLLKMGLNWGMDRFVHNSCPIEASSSMRSRKNLSAAQTFKPRTSRYVPSVTLPYDHITELQIFIPIFLTIISIFTAMISSDFLFLLFVFSLKVVISFCENIIIVWKIMTFLLNWLFMTTWEQEKKEK